ncbi:MAG: GntR family transcriptional regulator [Clostridia bacterium]|nr:GntR family transcriptional regulator [Clostridia bacterium]
MSRAEGYNLTTKVFNDVRQSIVSGEYPLGMALTEAYIAKKLNVSRTPVREAFRQLEAERLIEITPNKGAVVQGVTDGDVKDIYEIRSLIEGLAAERAALNATDEQIKALEENIALAQFYLGRNDFEHIKGMDNDFHQLIYDMTASKTFKHILGEMHSSAEKFRVKSIKSEGRVKEFVAEHTAVMEAIRERDGQKAKKLMTLHVNNSYNNLVKNCKLQQGE